MFQMDMVVEEAEEEEEVGDAVVGPRPLEEVVDPRS